MILYYMDHNSFNKLLLNTLAIFYLRSSATEKQSWPGGRDQKLEVQNNVSWSSLQKTEFTQVKSSPSLTSLLDVECGPMFTAAVYIPKSYVFNHTHDSFGQIN